jgi:ABC-type enterochelin transport system substrate-binding protein
MEIYFSYKNDNTMDLLLFFVKLAPQVRLKLDDSKSIEKLESALLTINQRYMTDKRASDIMALLEETLEKIRDPTFHAEV